MRGPRVFMQEALHLSELSSRLLADVRKNSLDTLAAHGIPPNSSTSVTDQCSELLERTCVMAGVHGDFSRQLLATGDFSSAEELEKAYMRSVGGVRAMEFFVRTLRKQVADLEKKENASSRSEKALDTRMQFLADAKSQLDVRIKQLEGELVSLQSQRSVASHVAVELEDAKRLHSEKLNQLEQLEKKRETMRVAPVVSSVPSLKARARDQIQQLLSELEFFEQKQGEVCEKKFSAFSAIIDQEEARLKYLTLQRELKVLQGHDTMDLGVDFEAADIDRQKQRLVDLHTSVQASEAKRGALAGRISELYADLEYLRW